VVRSLQGPRTGARRTGRRIRGPDLHLQDQHREEQELAAAFGIRSIPTLLFIPMEGKPQMAQGALPKASLKEAIDKVMLGK
jgi:predicted DsbA family dithiol-disulfide isomerase